MKIIEIISIRSRKASDCVAKINISELFKGTDIGIKPISIRLFYHKTFDTDISLHLEYNCEEEKFDENRLSLQLFPLLEECGVIHHSIWIEKQQIV